MNTTNTAQFVPTSENLTKIQSDITAVKIAIRNESDDLAQDKLIAQLGKLKADEKAEISTLTKSENDRLALEAKHARLVIRDNYRDAILADHIAQNDKKVSAEDKQAAADNLAAHHETIGNALIASFKPVGSAIVSGTASVGTVKGATSLAIVERYKTLKATEMSDADAKKIIVSEGFAVGTTGAAILAYQREIGVK